MKNLLVVFFCLSSLFGQSAGSVITSASNGTLTVYSISPTGRVSDLVSMFTAMTAPSSVYYNGGLSQIALQTTRNGLLVNVLSIVPVTAIGGTESTLLFVTYYPNGVTRHPTRPFYVVIPVEQVTELVYSYNEPIPPNANFSTTALPGVLPLFSVDMKQRAQDIQNAFTLLNGIPYAKAPPNPTVGLQTTLKGTFNDGGTIQNGFIPNVINISLSQAPNGTLLLVTYQKNLPVKNQVTPFVYYIIVSPEQVYGITYPTG